MSKVFLKGCRFAPWCMESLHNREILYGESIADGIRKSMREGRNC
jgi:hypothetical protein